jgi:hypothetical protein
MTKTRHLDYYVQRWKGTPPSILLPELTVKFRVEILTNPSSVEPGKLYAKDFSIYHRKESELGTYYQLRLVNIASESESSPHHIKENATQMQHARQVLEKSCQDFLSSIDVKLRLGPLDGGRRYYDAAFSIVISIWNAHTQVWDVGWIIKTIYWIGGGYSEALSICALEVEYWFPTYVQGITGIRSH